MKLLYKPFGIVFGILAGLVGRRIFNVVWGKIDDQEAPGATTQDAPWLKVVLAAVLQAGIFAAVRTAVNRAGARGFEHITGVWPGEKRPDPE